MVVEHWLTAGIEAVSLRAATGLVVVATSKVVVGVVEVAEFAAAAAAAGTEPLS